MAKKLDDGLERKRSTEFASKAEEKRANFYKRNMQFLNEQEEKDKVIKSAKHILFIAKRNCAIAREIGISEVSLDGLEKGIELLDKLLSDHIEKLLYFR